MSNIEILESQLRQIFAGVVWTHKIQEKQSDIYIQRNRALENIEIIGLAITASGICSTIFIGEKWIKIVTAIISLVTLGINLYSKSRNLVNVQSKHKKSALDLLELREELIAILCDIKVGRYTEEELWKKRDEIIKSQMKIYRECMEAGEKAITKASENLKIRRDNTYSDEEIDSFLPVLARKRIQI